MQSPFVHLHLHTEFALVDSTVRISALVEQARAMGMPALAVTDQNNLFALVKFYRAAERAGIKPIIGADLRIFNPTEPENSAPLVLLCQNRQGYHNLCRLLSRAYIEGQHRGVPYVQRSWISDCADGLIALSGGRLGDIGQALLNNHFNQAAQLLSDWQRDFPDRFYLEIQRTGRDRETEYEQKVLQLAAQGHCPVVASNDVRFLQSQDYAAHEARVCIHDGALLADQRRQKLYSEQQFLRSPEQMQELFSDLPGALQNSVEIAHRCNLEMRFGENILPAFPTPDDVSEPDFLRQVAAKGLQWRLDSYGKVESLEPSVYQARLEEELDVIIKMGFPGYFLIVADFIRWARKNAIPVGPGRGSGAGSLVAYALGITDLDPLRYDLLFERFLNPERVSLPDFDVDFCMEQRDRVIDYVAETYGRDHVSQIITYGSMAAKAVVRDCGRVLGHAYGFVDSIARLIPMTLGITLKQALKDEPQLQQRYDQEEDTRAVLDLAMALEGLTRNAGKHAGGVVIAPSALTEFAPLFCEPGGSGVVTQFDKDDVETIGLVKFDFLGLRTLTILDWAIKTINRQREAAGDVPVDLERLPLADRKTFKLLQDCKTTAVFQLESRGMKDLIRRLRPDNFEEIVALVALFRPGPLESGMVGDFIDRKHGRAPVVYPHPSLETILSSTYGVILYQEQVMQIAQELGGYSLGAADLLRRAMGKKKPDEMALQREIFVEGAMERDVGVDQANYIFDQMETFAGYGFNKSHSAAYALIAYQTAYLKAHFPAAFMAAVLSADMDNTDKISIIIDDCRKLGLNVMPPDVNHCDYHFTAADQNTIHYGLGAIKGVGHAVIDSICEKRVATGEFSDLADFCGRVDLQRINRRVLETLVRSGALDKLDPDQNRARLMELLPQALQAAEQLQRDREAGQNDMFGAPDSEIPKLKHTAVPEWPEELRLRGERQTLGLYLTGHPVAVHRQDLKQFTDCPLSGVSALLPEDADRETRQRGRKRGVAMTLAGLIDNVNRRPGRGAFVAIDDGSARLEVALFDETFALYADKLVKDEIIVIEGKVARDNFSGGYRMTADKIMTLAEAKSTFAKGVSISVRGPQPNLVYLLETTFAPYRKGQASVWLNYQNGRARAQLELADEFKVKACEELIAALNEIEPVREARLVY